MLNKLIKMLYIAYFHPHCFELPQRNSILSFNDFNAFKVLKDNEDIIV